MAIFKNGDMRLYYLEQGSGMPLVFLHGFALDSRIWLNQVSFFAEKYNVIATDARGHGRSDAPATGYAREDRVRDILALIDHIGADKIHLVGLSMGGGDALALALDHPEKLHSLTLVGTVAAGWKPSRKFKDYSPTARDISIEKAKIDFMRSVLVRYDKTRPELKGPLEEMMNAFSGKPWTDPMKGKYPVRDDLSRAADLNLPVCIIVGRQDILFYPLSVRLRELIPAVSFHVISGAGHLVNFESPDIFNRHLMDFLQDIDS